MVTISRLFIQNIDNLRLWINKKNSLFNLICHQPYIDKIYLYAKDPYEVKYQFLIKKGKDVGTKHFNDSQDLIEYSNDIDDFYKKHRRT